MDKEKHTLIAHVKKTDAGQWEEPQSLDEHHNGTSRLAGEFSTGFNSSTWGRLLGLLHDTGKSTSQWQEYLVQKSGFGEDDADLEGKRGIVEHSTTGAKLAEEILGKGLGRLFSYCIAGHHAGLPDWLPDEAGAQSALQYRLQQAQTTRVPARIKECIHSLENPSAPWKFDNRHQQIDLSLWIRMLFSCLVDADRLDTECYMNPEKTVLRNDFKSVAQLLSAFNRYMIEMVTQKVANIDSPVNRVRQQVLADCRAAAQKPKGFYSLTVPTGGGKTLSSMAFALEHAALYKMERIIYVIPYTSIIEQNAEVFRSVFGGDQIVEHHSSIGEEHQTVKSQLAVENWDAPIIVTTSVQFFESLFSAKPSRCRKLHNIVNSVIILDEAQLVPTDFLAPILQTMDLLVQHYGVSFVISTATQPALQSREGFKGLTTPVTEIVGDVSTLYRALNRVSIITPADRNEIKDWKTIAAELLHYEQVLCVVSDRKSCRALHREMPHGTIHLSALMCGQHRSDVIAQIKQKLKNKEPVRVISTQLVEAGVDIDFPVVYRSIAGLDSIAQAAGRCNREGLLDGLGKVVVFRSPKNPPIGILRKAAEAAQNIIQTAPENLLEHSLFSTFFNDLYWRVNSLDSNGIVKLLTPDREECGIQFRTASQKFTIIDDKNQKQILVPYGEGRKHIDLLRKTGPEKWLLRKLQRYTVNVYTGDFFALENRGSIAPVVFGGAENSIYAVTNDHDYDETLGLLVDDPPDNLDIFIQ